MAAASSYGRSLEIILGDEGDRVGRTARRAARRRPGRQKEEESRRGGAGGPAKPILFQAVSPIADSVGEDRDGVDSKAIAQ